YGILWTVGDVNFVLAGFKAELIAADHAMASSRREIARRIEIEEIDDTVRPFLEIDITVFPKISRLSVGMDRAGLEPDDRHAGRDRMAVITGAHADRRRVS